MRHARTIEPAWPIAAALATILFLAGCSGGSVPVKADSKPAPALPEGGLWLRGAGATFPAVLYDEWFQLYRKAHPGTVITYDAVGSGEGVRRFIGRNIDDGDRIDFGASDAALRDDEVAMVRDGALLVPLTAGSIALAYNLPDVPEVKLTRQAYVGIFTGAITNWNDLRIARANPGLKLPSLTIATVVRQDGSGTTFAFTKHLDAINEQWRSQHGPATLVNWPGNSMRAAGNDGVAGRIKQSVGSVGYVGAEFARRAGLQVALLENRAGNFVRPTEESSTSALSSAELSDNMRAYVPDPPQRDAYPIVTLTWVLLYQHYADPRKASGLYDLFRWCLTEGQEQVSTLGYTPLPNAVKRASLETLDRLKPTSAP
jgi:phosphate transport system substrate-binding protein